MTRVDRVRTPEEATALVGTLVEPKPTTITTETIGIDSDTGQPVFAYLPLPRRQLAQLRQAILNVPYTSTTQRANGTTNNSRTFGGAPRRPVYGREACSQTRLTYERPHTASVLAEWAEILEQMLTTIDPTLTADGKQQSIQVGQDWRLGHNQLWTSGVINKSSKLPYHRDAFNFPVWSAMPVLRRNMTGGYLTIPEYDATFQCRDGWALFFPGHQLVHGVTPMTPTQRGGYRYSIVYYALKGMKDCHTAAQETAYGLKRRTERERDIATRLKTGDTTVPTTNRKKNLTGDPTAIEDAYLNQEHP